MGVGELYGLFICIVTARSWKAVSEGVNRTQVTEQEVRLVHHIIALHSDLASRNQRVCSITYTSNLASPRLDAKRNASNSQDQ